MPYRRMSWRSRILGVAAAIGLVAVAATVASQSAEANGAKCGKVCDVDHNYCMTTDLKMTCEGNPCSSKPCQASIDPQ